MLPPYLSGGPAPVLPRRPPCTHENASMHPADAYTLSQPPETPTIGPPSPPLGPAHTPNHSLPAAASPCPCSPPAASPRRNQPPINSGLSAPACRHNDDSFPAVQADAPRTIPHDSPGSIRQHPPSATRSPHPQPPSEARISHGGVHLMHACTGTLLMSSCSSGVGLLGGAPRAKYRRAEQLTPESACRGSSARCSTPLRIAHACLPQLQHPLPPPLPPGSASAGIASEGHPDRISSTLRPLPNGASMHGTIHSVAP